MKTDIKALILLVAAMTMLLVAVSVCLAQESQQPDAQQPPPLDPIRQLNLTPEQRQQIRAITEERKEERVAINQRLREANNALQAVLDSDDPDEALVEQRLRDVAAAQAAQMRMRVLTEVRIRRVLTPEQQTLLRILRQQARLERQLEDSNRRNRIMNRQFPNQRNGLTPGAPQRNVNQAKQP
jgi:Spy/CpxP family protein refolding chaperone